MTDLDELPIGSGQLRDHDDQAATVSDDDRELAQVLELPPVGTSVQTGPAIEIEWEARRLKKPLQLVVGRTVNWRIKSRLGVETDAGLMSDEQALNIAEPASEILNRYEPTRLLAARGVELELIAAIYEYVQETSVRAGQAAYAAGQGERAAARPAGAPPPAPVQPFSVETQIPRSIPLDDEGDDQL